MRARPALFCGVLAVCACAPPANAAAAAAERDVMKFLRVHLLMIAFSCLGEEVQIGCFRAASS
jgi:hypothetical protein